MYVLAPRGADTGHRRFSASIFGRYGCAGSFPDVGRVCSSVFQSISFTVSLEPSLIWGIDQWASIISMVTALLISHLSSMRSTAAMRSVNSLDLDMVNLAPHPVMWSSESLSNWTRPTDSLNSRCRGLVVSAARTAVRISLRLPARTVKTLSMSVARAALRPVSGAGRRLLSERPSVSSGK